MRLFFYSMLLAAFSISLILLGYNLHDEPKDQNSFLSDGTLQFASALLVTIIFALLIQSILRAERVKLEEDRRRYDVAISLHNQFHSPEMVEIRCRVDRLMERCYREGLYENTSSSAYRRDLYFDWYLSVNPTGQSEEWLKNNPDWEERNKDWIAKSTLTHFYENMHKLIEQNQVDAKLLKAWFKTYFSDVLCRNHFSKEMERMEKIGAVTNWVDHWRKLADVFDIDLKIHQTEALLVEA